MRCAKQYERNLLEQLFLIIYRDRKDNQVKSLEIYFGKEKLTDSPSQVLEILSKGKGEEKYSTVRHVTKGLEYQKLCMPESIRRTILADLFCE